MRLCFGLLLETVFITQGTFSFCPAAADIQSGPLLLLIPPHQQRAWGAQKAGRRHSQEQLTQTESKDAPDHMASCLACKVRERRKKGGCLEWWHLSSKASVTLFPRGWLSTCLPWGSGEWIPCFALLQHSFCFPYWSVSISTHEFCHFYSADSLLHPIMGEWVSSCVGLTCQLRLNHDTKAVKLHILLNPYALEHPWNK